MTSVTLRPGVNTMMTLSQNEAGVSQSNLVRYQQGMIQKYGGWSQYFPIAIGSTIHELFGWQGLLGNSYLGVGAQNSLSVITSGGAGSNTDITPQTLLFDNPPNFSISSGSNVVTIVDAGSSVTTFDAVYFNTPVAIGNLLINGGPYQINSVLGASSYTILSSIAASTTITSSGILPTFAVSSGSAQVIVTLPNNNFPATLGLDQQFIAPTSVGGLTIQGPYVVQTVIDSTRFTIAANNQGSSAATATMNGGNAEMQYFYALGPPLTLGYGGGGYGSGGYGTGAAAPAGTGTPITANDWTMANWGETLLACPTGGPIYSWSANSGLFNAAIVPNAPFFNGGIFVSQPQQILVAWGSVQSTGVHDPLVVRWSDALNYNNWVVNSQTWAGSFHISTGSIIRGGIQSAQQGIIWTDIDCYVMQNVGQPIVFGFNLVGSGCGLVGPHAMGVLNGNVYWMGPNNLFELGVGGVRPLPCPVWNFIFQNIDQQHINRVTCAVNSLFNEIAWFFPAFGGLGQNTLYAKLNVTEGEWDYGVLGRSAWIDVTVLGNPIAADLGGVIWQHDTGFNAGTVAMDSSFQTGYWSISDGNELAFVDWIMPDMTWNDFAHESTTASLTLTFFAVDYPGDTPRQYGPYTFSQGTEFINTRIRGRLMSLKVEGADLDSFWRIGRIRYRFAVDGRR
jgi:hypothetical protein